MQCALATTANQLKQLRHELNFTDTPDTDFDIVQPVSLGGVSADLSMQAAHFLDRGVIVIAAVNKRAGQRVQAGNGVCGTGDGARLQPGITFPGPCLGDEIIFQRRKARYQWATCSEWSQAHVDTKNESIAIDLIECADHTFANFGMKFVPRALSIRVAVLGMDEYQVDVGRDIELAPTQLAHADNHQLRGLGIGRVKREFCGHRLRIVALRGGDADFR